MQQISDIFGSSCDYSMRLRYYALRHITVWQKNLTRTDQVRDQTFVDASDRRCSDKMSIDMGT